MTLKDFSQSLQLLIILCKTNWSDKDLDFIKKHFSANESNVFILSERHRISPLIWSAHQRLSLFSKDYYNELKRKVEENQIRTFQVATLQAKLEKLMSANGVNGFFLKGIFLAKRYYKDIAERHVLDVDLFVGAQRLGEMSKLLNDLGYQSYPNIMTFTKLQLKYYLNTHHDLYFFNPDDKNFLPVELHWKLRGPWSSFDLIPDSGLNMIDEFLYLCVHGTEHGWFRLKWLMDLPRMIIVSDFDWSQVSTRAGELNCSKQLEITLIILENLQLIDLPDYWEGKLNVEKYRFQIEYILNAIAAETTFQENDVSRLRYFRYLRSFHAGTKNILIWKNFMTSHNDWKLIQLPEPLFFMYFILRPFFWLYRRIQVRAQIF